VSDFAGFSRHLSCSNDLWSGSKPMGAAHKALVFVSWVVLIVAGIGAGIVMHRLWEFRNGLERMADGLTLDAGPESTLIYDAKNNLVSALFEEHRIGVTLAEMSPHLINGVLVTEDRRFFDHDGIDPRRIVMAAIANQRAGEIVQGGSTITQQLVRSILLNRKRATCESCVRRFWRGASKSATASARFSRPT
jgi:membrane peptidoglycan carboxypeptidase